MPNYFYDMKDEPTSSRGNERRSLLISNSSTLHRDAERGGERVLFGQSVTLPARSLRHSAEFGFPDDHEIGVKRNRNWERNQFAHLQ